MMTFFLWSSSRYHIILIDSSAPPSFRGWGKVEHDIDLKIANQSSKKDGAKAPTIDQLKALKGAI